MQNLYTDPLLDDYGNPRAHDDGTPYLLYQDPDMAAAFFNQDGTSNGRTPFFDVNENEYYSLRNTEPFCTGDIGAVSMRIYGRITLCPSTFSLNGFQNIPAANLVGPQIPLTAYRPASSVLLHEMLHLLLMDRNYRDEVYGVGECLNLARSQGGYDKAYGNPESHAWFALGATLSRMARTRQDDSLYLEWSTGEGFTP
ncbi:hypothetical protein Dda_2774 [Drechslerella dactyloides]|uniref:Uncharacterized protein n=1 Tax=Drechslerella dactyloides TaxID=74499 RepID=A0AAD6J042_DREDA|nr:hypothetical protein Dda_2774 [Drechslerella dactyloides]